ncbi:MAG: hypothetical protein ACI9D5_000149 [Candidatus Endobugula sp.]|jgi:hypothetical protein
MTGCMSVTYSRIVSKLGMECEVIVDIRQSLKVLGGHYGGVFTCRSPWCCLYSRGSMTEHRGDAARRVKLRYAG